MHRERSTDRTGDRDHGTGTEQRDEQETEPDEDPSVSGDPIVRIERSTPSRLAHAIRARDRDRAFREDAGERQESGRQTDHPSDPSSNSQSPTSSPRSARMWATLGTSSGGLETAIVPVASSVTEERRDDRLSSMRPFDRSDLPHDPAPVPEPGELHDDVDRRGDLIADVRGRKLDVRHHRHRLEAPEQVPAGVRVGGRQGPVVAGVHRLEHVEGFTPADLADDDPVGAHPEGVADEVTNRHLAATLDVRRPRLERDDVRLMQAELGRVFDRDQALLVRDERGQDAEERRLAAAGATADDEVGTSSDARREEPKIARGRWFPAPRCRHRTAARERTCGS